ncbi:MAG: hypothetical protein AAFP90_22610, partial [Planctomycetota bacterium]
MNPLVPHQIKQSSRRHQLNVKTLAGGQSATQHEPQALTPQRKYNNSIGERHEDQNPKRPNGTSHY